MKYMIVIILFVSGCATLDCKPGFTCDTDTTDVVETCAADYVVQASCKF